MRPPPVSERLLALAAGAALLAGCAATAPAPTPVVKAAAVTALYETPPVQSAMDAADDPAIWANPSDPAASLVVGTDKKAGLNLYDMQGRLLQFLPDGHMNNVDLRDGFPFPSGPDPIVTASNRTTNSIAIYRLDVAARRLVSAAADLYPTGLTDAYGQCMYRSARSGDVFVFINDKDGRMKQWRLTPAADGKVAAEPVREFKFASQVEGCAADDETGRLYVAEEAKALWRLSAEPNGGGAMTAVAPIAANPDLHADLEGVSIYKLGDGRGYIIVSVQGANTYAVFRREGDNAYLGSFRVVDNPANGVDGVSETDGLDVSSAPLGPDFPHGALVTQDGHNDADKANQNFKYVSWDAIAEALNLERAR
jgi:3-phytase